MLRYILLLILIIASCKVFSQPSPGNEKQRIRLISHFQYLSNDSLAYADSLMYAYSGSRGSSFSAIDFGMQNDYGYVNYNYSFFHNLALPAADMPEPFKDIHSINVWYDSMRQVSIISNPYMAGNIYSHTVNLYYSDSVLTTARSFYNPDQSEYISYINYDANRNPVHILTTSNLMSQLDTFFTRQIVYDGNGKPVADLAIDNMNVHHSREYIYDAAGRIILITDNYDPRYGTGETYRQFIGYDNAGRLQTFMQQRYYGQTEQWLTTDTVYYGRDGQGRITSMTANTRLQFTMHYNPDGDADTLKQYAYDLDMGKVASCNTTTFFYNKYHNPDSAITYVFDSCHTTTSRLQRTLYYYETYVADTLVIGGEVVLFPNPAHNKIYIKWNKIFSVIPVDIVVYNSVGQVMGKTNIAVPSPVDTIDISGYAPGVYFLRIKNAKGKQLYIGRFVVGQ